MTNVIDETRFELEADRTLLRLETCLTELDDSLDVDLSMGVLTVEFESGRKFVINSHRAARQIWMSAYATAWHFDLTNDAWISTKSQEELFGVVNEQVGKELGYVVSLSMN
ncbi:MAG: iron donor protein CyaY [Myxococcota bacterium]|nr:iron donor protein CyaY [Myxococcota bacterium]